MGSMTSPADMTLDDSLDGFRLWPGRLTAADQAQLRDQVLAALEAAPLYRPVTPGGRPFSVRMSNLGPLGWVSDRAGYRYQAVHPETGAPWPPIPRMLLTLWDDLTGWPAPPDACLVNLYDADARMGLHQDKGERDLTAPVLSVSLGDTAVFRIGAAGGRARCGWPRGMRACCQGRRGWRGTGSTGFWADRPAFCRGAGA